MGNPFVNIWRRLRLGEDIIVVSGLPRSGTSMMMRMLEAGGYGIWTDSERAADEDNPRGYFELERVMRLESESDRSWLREARGQALKVVSPLLKTLPRENAYRVILMLRDLDEVIASQNRMLERRGEANSMDDERTRAAYQSHMRDVRRLIARRPGSELLEVRYDETVAEPSATARRVRDFLGRSADVDAMARAVDPSLYRNRLAPALALAFGLGWLAVPELAHAYVGPGAGFAFVSSFAMLAIALFAVIFSMATWPARAAIRALRRRRLRARARVKRMIILGLDGLDPELVDEWMARGELPNLERLAAMGSYSRLGTTYPSISPVAWSSFMTGVSPARHNVFDFITRDPRTYAPALAGSEVGGPRRTLRVGQWVIPLGRPLVRSLRRSKAFWSILGEHGVPCHVLRVPLTFPPEKFAGALLSAMCVPDLRGTQGSFTFYTTDPGQSDGSAPGGEGGGRELVVERDGAIRAELAGPPNPLREQQEPLAIPFTLEPDRANKRARLRIAGKKIWLAEKEYSPWIRLRFGAAPGVNVHGIARFFITSLEPHVGLYVTPINIDPARPALPISFPSYYALYLQKMIGDFATLGLAEDTWALNEGVIDEDAFLQQTWDLHEEREKMFYNALDKSREGVVACVFDGTDRLQHMFFRYLDPEHPAAKTPDAPRFADAILEMYRRADRLVGRALETLGPRDQLIVLSDHGFKSFRRGVNLNTWLHKQGLLVLRDEPGAGGEWFAGVDWKATRAYAMGLGGIYLNLRGREAQGCVDPGEDADALRAELMGALGGLRDKSCDEVAITRLYDAAQAYGSGPYASAGPDLIVGYAAGYRASWEGAVGQVTEEVFCDNTRAWSGDHCIDPELVPGVLFSSRAIAADDANITDMAPTVLTQFGVEPPEHMTGRALAVADEDSGAGAGAGAGSDAGAGRESSP